MGIFESLGRLPAILLRALMKTRFKSANEGCAIDALIAELVAGAEEIDRAIEVTSNRPCLSDVERLKQLNQKSRTLTSRMKRFVNGDVGHPFLAAARRYHQAIIRMGKKLRQCKSARRKKGWRPTGT